jgi:probable HAF family extracellular repeat protein
VYIIQPLFGPGTSTPDYGATYPFAINASGIVAGVTYSLQQVPSLPGPQYTETGALWHDGRLIYSQPWAQSNSSCLYSVNAATEAAGVRATENSPTQQGDLVREFAVSDLPSAAGVGSIATHINDAGLAVGWSWDNPESFIYDEHSSLIVARIPPVPGKAKSAAMAINASQQVVGTSDDHGFCFESGSLKDLGLAGFVSSINNAGIACGSIGKPEPQNFSPGIWDVNQTSASFVELPVPAGFLGGHADGINLRGDVVGSCWTANEMDESRSAYLYSNGVSIDLNSRVFVAGWHLTYATAINDAGQITGYGTYKGQRVGFVMTPGLLAPPPPRTGHHRVRVPELVATLLGGVAVDGSGWAIIDGHANPVGPYGPWLSLAAAKRDALTALALDELAMYIENASTRTAVRTALIESASLSLKALGGSAEQGRSVDGRQNLAAISGRQIPAIALVNGKLRTPRNIPR